MGDQSAHDSVCVDDVAKVARAVERMEAAVDENGGVADVVAPGGGLESSGFVRDRRRHPPSLGGHALGMRPASG
jgi:hypothetical protein